MRSILIGQWICAAGKKAEVIRENLERIFEELRWRQPALLLLDDLDELAPSLKGPDDELGSHHLLVAAGFVTLQTL